MTATIRSGILTVLALILSVPGTLQAQQADEAFIPGDAGGDPPLAEGIAGVIPVPITGNLFVGTALNTTGGGNDVYLIDPDTDTPTSVLTLENVWGATADPATERVLFTSSTGSTNGDVLYAVPYAGGSPTALGTIIDTSDSQPQRIDGLAMSGGILYGSYAASTAEDGLWQIDVNTLQATLIAPFSDSISGIDADPATGVIYGVNDTTGQLVTIATDGTITNVAPYPDGFDDIDGLAVGNGFAYLVIDEAGSFPVYDLVNEVYVTALTSPFTAADTFAGAAIALSAATSRATFAVTKDFTDDNPAGVEVTISCNTGLPLEQSKVITEGESVEFVVVDFDNGEMDCEVTEEVPAGYGAEYFDGATTSSASCEFLDIEFGSEFSCQITNTPGPVDVVIHKEWVFEGSSDPQGIDQRYDLTLFCDAEIVDGIEVGPFQEAPAGNGPPCGLIALPGQDGPQGFADWCKAFFGEGPDTFVAEVIPEFPDSHCFVIERLFDSAVEVDNGCRNITVSAGNGAECTITNTVFFEGIPTLTQYGLALLALLMLGVGFIGFRRFA